MPFYDSRPFIYIGLKTLRVIFFVHGLEVQLWQSSRPQFDTLFVHAYSEKDTDPIALHFVFLVHACLGRDLGRRLNWFSTAPNLAFKSTAPFSARDMGGKICPWQEILQKHRKLQQYPQNMTK
ncbi:hypothetical protein GQ457_18G014830 [Hibiscus cannabinus]